MSNSGFWSMDASAASRRLSLLSSKSLNNLQTEPAESVAAQKSARRAQRILPGPGGGITISAGIPASRGNGVVEIDSDRLEDESPLVSFQDAAANFMESNSGIISDTSRQRAINPRKSRRLATDFGLGYNKPPPPELPSLYLINTSPSSLRGLTPTLSSPASTPLSLSDAYTASDTSSLQGLVGFASEFPQPPSLSPALRRMQSVPWLKDGGNELATSVTDSVLAVRPNSHIRVSDIPFAPDDIQTFRSDDTSSYGSSALSQTARLRSRGLDFERVGEALIGLDMNSVRSRPGHAADRVSWTNRSNRKTWTTDDLLQWSVSHRTQVPRESTDESSFISATRRERPASSSHFDNRRYTMCGRPQEEIVEKRKIIRKVASMQNRSKEASITDKAYQRPIQKIKSMRLFPSSSSSKQELSRTGSKRNWLFSRSSHRQGVSSMDCSRSVVFRPPPNRTPYPTVPVHDVPSAASFSKIQPVEAHRRDSVWLSGLGFSNYEFPTEAKLSEGGTTTTKPRGQITPHYRTRSLAAKSHGNLPDTMDSSFISFTSDGKSKPDRVGVDKKSKVQRLLSRASMGFMEWSKNLTNRRHSP